MSAVTGRADRSPVSSANAARAPSRISVSTRSASTHGRARSSRPRRATRRRSRRIDRIAQREPRHTRALLREAREVGRTAFIGTIATAVVQGVLAGFGYAALGVPHPVTWAVITALASFLPVIGTAIVWVPVAG